MKKVSSRDKVHSFCFSVWWMAVNFCSTFSVLESFFVPSNLSMGDNFCRENMFLSLFCNGKSLRGLRLILKEMEVYSLASSSLETHSVSINCSPRLGCPGSNLSTAHLRARTIRKLKIRTGDGRTVFKTLDWNGGMNEGSSAVVVAEHPTGQNE